MRFFSKSVAVCLINGIPGGYQPRLPESPFPPSVPTKFHLNLEDFFSTLYPVEHFLFGSCLSYPEPGMVRIFFNLIFEGFEPHYPQVSYQYHAQRDQSSFID